LFTKGYYKAVNAGQYSGKIGEKPTITDDILSLHSAFLRLSPIPFYRTIVDKICYLH